MPATQIVRVVTGADQQANLVTKYTIPLDEPIGIGNNGAVQVSFSGSNTNTVTDSAGGTWTKRKNNAGGGGQKHELWTRENITDQPTSVIVNVSSTGNNYLSASFAEACGAGAYDTGAVGSGTSTTPTVASFTPTAGALVYETFLQDTSATFLTLVTPGIGYVLHFADLVFSFLFGQSKIHTSGAVTPGCTMSASRGWSALAISWLADTSKGVLPVTAPRITATLNHSLLIAGTTWKLAFPIGALDKSAVFEFEVAPGIGISNIADTGGNTYTLVDSISTTSGGKNEYWKVTGPLAGGSTNVATITYTGSTNDNFVTIKKFASTPNDPVSQSAKKTSGNSTSGTTISGATFTPPSTNCLILRLLGVQSSTVTAVNRGAFISLRTVPDIGSPAPLMQNNGYGVEHNPAVSSQQATWTLLAFPNDWQELSIIIDGTPTSVDVTVNPTGVSATGSVGNVSVSGNAGVAPTGVSATSSVHSVTVSGNAGVAPTGVGGAGAVGSVTVSVSGDVTVNPSGVVATGAVGSVSVSVSGDANIALTGVSGAGAVGSVAVTGGATVLPAGSTALGRVGSPTIDTNGSTTVNVTGVTGTGAIGTISLSGGASVAPAGVAAAGHVGFVFVPQGIQILDRPQIAIEPHLTVEGIEIS